MRDLRGNWVFPRLAYAATGHAIDRNARRSHRVLFVHPRDYLIQFALALREHRDVAEIVLAALVLFAVWLRALTLLLVSLGLLLLAVSHL